MALRRLRKSADSFGKENCPAVYIDDDPAVLVAQGRALAPPREPELLERADDEIAVVLPAETVLRAVGVYLAERGRPGVLAEIEDHLAGATR
ncbi:MAG: hypothetical protein ACT4RN_05575 [Pseudonocardia sp.]